MKYVGRIAAKACVVAGLSASLYLNGCTDKSPTAPHAKPKLALVSENTVTVKSEITLYNKNGTENRKYTKTQLLQTERTGGVLRAVLAAPSGVSASVQVTDSSAQSAGYTQPLTPVLGVRYGSGVANYTQYVTDSTTMKVYKVVATGPQIYNYPIDVMYAYDSRGYKVAEIHYKWSAVTGGYALLAQKELSYSSTGTLSATVTSYVSSPVTYVAAALAEPAPNQFASMVRRVACYFAPTVAYAQGKGKGGGDKGTVSGNSMPLPGSACWGEGGILAINIGIVGVESATPGMELWDLPGYLGSWTALGHSLWHFLDCLGRPPRCTGFCGGGGGSSW